MRTLKGYKVVSVARKKRWSWTGPPGPGTSGAVEYRRGKWTRPFKSCGPLTMFGTRAIARAFMWGNDDEELWRCEYRPSTRGAAHNRSERCPLVDLPSGTILAEAVKLTRRVA